RLSPEPGRPGPPTGWAALRSWTAAYPGGRGGLECLGLRKRPARRPGRPIAGIALSNGPERTAGWRLTPGAPGQARGSAHVPDLTARTGQHPQERRRLG